ncbi:threonine/homoserine efflux transporter RhtA [Streptacidiphilus sp. MAP12-33]|uniref:hypothetical protein n=1 Tax=Streptacidiphilus sp. MAP12-33 TaxID=3156266 RepID=UPI0035117A6C
MPSVPGPAPPPGLLSPLVPFALEFLTLRRLTASAFGTLMSLEPAIALLVGAVVLHRIPGPGPAQGTALVVTAGIGATRTGARPEPSPTPPPDHAPHPARADADCPARAPRGRRPA